MHTAKLGTHIRLVPYGLKDSLYSQLSHALLDTLNHNLYRIIHEGLAHSLGNLNDIFLRKLWFDLTGSKTDAHR